MEEKERGEAVQKGIRFDGEDDDNDVDGESIEAKLVAAAAEVVESALIPPLSLLVAESSQQSLARALPPRAAIVASCEFRL